MERYSVIEHKNPREIVLLKGRCCEWGLCSFCDYIHDNSNDELDNNLINLSVLTRVTGKYKSLEVINSGSCFDLPQGTIDELQKIVQEKGIKELYFESHYMYKERLAAFRAMFKDVHIMFKCGIETFDEYFRNKVLKKGVSFQSPEEVASYFDSICLMVGIKGQTKEMINNDMEILQKYFRRGCINVFVENSTEIKADQELIDWFKDRYSYLEEEPNIEILWNNTDFGVGNTGQILD